MEEFSIRLNSMMHDKGVTERKLAMALNVPGYELARYCEGKGLEPLAFLKRLVVRSGLSADWWLGLEGPNREPDARKLRRQLEEAYEENGRLHAYIYRLEKELKGA